jgi:POTRA domain, FtsQ-type/Cell division protein FtsQ
VVDVLNGPRIDPRFVQRWIEVRRAEGRRRLRVLIAVASLLGLILVAFGSLYTPLFHVRHIRVTVTGPVAKSAVVARAGVGHRDLMIHVNPAQITRRLDAYPGLGGARVAKHWPGTVSIRVSVRTPVANVARSGGGWATVDATGRVLADRTAPAIGLPVLQGAGPVPAPGQWLAGALGPAVIPGTKPSAALNMDASPDSATLPSAPAAALVVLQSLPAPLLSEVVNVSVGPSGISLAVLPANVATGSVSVDLGDESQLGPKVLALDALLTETNLANVVSIDLTVPDRPAVLTAR